MEWLWILGIIVAWFVIQLGWTEIKRALFGVGSVVEEGTIVKMLVRANKEKADLEDDTQIDVLSIETVGLMPGPWIEKDTQFVAHLTDITTNESAPVFCVFDEMQEPLSRAFEIASEPIPLSRDSYISDWTTLFTVPVDFLVFPQGGSRQIQCTLSLVDASDPPTFVAGAVVSELGAKVHGQAKTSFSISSPDLGYLEQAENRDRIEELTVELAMHIGAADGSLDKVEADIIKQWVSKLIASMDESFQDDEKLRLNKATEDAFRKASKGQTSVDEIAVEFNEIGSTQEKYDAIELALDVMSADGVADDSELAELNQIVIALDLDPEKFRSLRERRLSKVSNLAEVMSDAEEVLGIHSNMSKDEIRSHLASEFRKWNARVNHKDEEVRNQAREMLDLIGKARNKHLGDD